MFPIHVVAAWLAAGLMPVSAAPTSPALAHVVVRVYGASPAAPISLSAARATTQAVFKDAGIDVVWRECDGAERAAACDDVPGPGEAIVRLVGAGAQAPAGLLGSSYVDLHQHGGCLATIYVDRVERLARVADFDASTLLGRAIAHELGHLLLGTPKHSARGLMRAEWSDVDLRNGRPADWVLSRDEGARMRAAALARVAVTTPVLLVAGR
jgi:hypothetical protein